MQKRDLFCILRERGNEGLEIIEVRRIIYSHHRKKHYFIQPYPIKDILTIANRVTSKKFYTVPEECTMIPVPHLK